MRGLRELIDPSRPLPILRKILCSLSRHQASGSSDIHQTLLTVVDIVGNKAVCQPFGIRHPVRYHWFDWRYDCTMSRHCFSWLVSHLWFDWRQWLYQEPILFLVVILGLIEGSDCTKSRHCFSWSSWVWLKAVTVPRADIVSRGHLGFDWRGDYTIFPEIWFFFCPCHNFFPLSSVQIIIIPACCLLCVL